MKRFLVRTLTLCLGLLWLTVFSAEVLAEDLSMGDRGPRVREIQERLIELGYDPGPSDGIFGNMTRKALRSFQIDRDLPVTGVVDERVFAALTAVVSAPEREPVVEDSGPDDFSAFEDFESFDDWGGTRHEFTGHIRAVAAARTEGSTERFPFYIGDYWYNEGEVFYQGEDLDKISMQQNQLRLTWEGSYENDFSSLVQVDAEYSTGPEHPFADDGELELDEAYLSYHGDLHSFTFGKRKVVWGISDVFSPFNVVSSADLVDPFVNSGVQDLQGQWQITWNYERQGEYRLETLLIPVWNASVIPTAEHDDEEYLVYSDYWVPPLFSQLPSLIMYNIPVDDGFGGVIWTDVLTEHIYAGVKEPESGPESASLGARLSVSRGEWDLTGYVFTGLDPTPSPVVEAVFFDEEFWYEDQLYNLIGYSAEISMEFPRIYVIGQSAESVIGKVRFKQEAAVTYGRKSFPDLTTEKGVTRLLNKVNTNQDYYTVAREEGEEYTALNLVFGADYTFGALDLISSAQLKLTTRPGWDESSFGEQTDSRLTLYLQRSFGEDQWTASMGALMELNTGAGFFSPRLKYAPMYHEHLEFSGGLNYFRGPEAEEALGFVSYPSVLASYRDYSHVFVMGRILFGL